MIRGNTAKRLRESEFRVAPEDRPGWVRGDERTPGVGEAVYCAGGEGTILSLHGKTGDGSRLLQISLPGEKPRSFFAAASNVLVRPR